ncbi:hypothetical protein AB6N24_15610 [Cellulomonas sp. 179-A 4D5 NHS]|uniref:hypothetical protein n=1 Tax=Cellulomonas sp. 179-A 4D5 NHS TaxID=3142378 RepID=UPI0039A3BE86
MEPDRAALTPALRGRPAAEPVPAPTGRFPPGGRAVGVLELQRTAGNSAVAAVLAGRVVQRCGPIPHEVCPCNADGPDDQHAPEQPGVQREPEAPAAAPTPSALDVSEIKDIEDFSGYSEGDRLGFVARLHDQAWVGPYDEAALERIWGSFDASNRLEAVAGGNIALFRDSIEYGAELDELPYVVRARAQFTEDVKGTAARFLTDNRAYVTAQLEQLGLQPGAPGGSQQDVAQRQADALEDIKRDAQVVTRAQEAQGKLLTLQVGWEIDTLPDDLPSMRHVEGPAMFDPKGPPMFGPRDEQPPLPAWEQVNEHYQRISALIAGVANNNPAIFAAMREDGLGSLRGDDPQVALQAVGTTLRKVLTDIDASGPKIADGDLDYRDLVPIHQQLFSGTTRGPTQTDWSKPLAQDVAKQVLADHEASEFWISLGLGTLAAAAFVVAELATLGSATFFIAAGVGLAAGGIQAGRSWEQYFDMAQAADATVRDNLSVLSQGQASTALLGAVVDTAFLFLDAYQVGAKGVQVAAEQAGRATGREAAEQAERELMELARKEAADGAQAMEQRAGAGAAREAAEATGTGVLHEAPTRIGTSEHHLKAIGSGGRPTLWLCSDCVILADRVSDVLKQLPTDHTARTELGEILANAQRWQRAFESTQRGVQIGEARLVRETNDLASRLTALSAQNTDLEGLLFFRTFLAGSEEATRILGEQVARRLTAELGEAGLVQLVRDLGPDALRNLADLTGAEIRQLVETRGRDLVRWLGDGGTAAGVGGLTGARARELLGLVPEDLLNAFRAGRSRTSALVVHEAVQGFGAATIQRLRTMMGDRFTGAVLDDFRQWRMVVLEPDLAPLVRGNRGRVVREGLPSLEGRIVEDIEDILRSAGMNGPAAERGMRIWTHADGSVVRIKVGSQALRGQRTVPHLVREISERPGRYGVDDIIAKIAEGGEVLPAGRKFAETSLANWFHAITGRDPSPDELTFLVDLWADAGHTNIIR